MKKFMVTGGLLGFLIGLTFGLAQQSAWPSVIWKSSVAAFGAGILLRWWGRLWIRSLQQAHQQASASSEKLAASKPLTLTKAA